MRTAVARKVLELVTHVVHSRRLFRVGNLKVSKLVCPCIKRGIGQDVSVHLIVENTMDQHLTTPSVDQFNYTFIQCLPRTF